MDRIKVDGFLPKSIRKSKGKFMTELKPLIAIVNDSAKIVNQIIENGGIMPPELKEEFNQMTIDLSAKLDAYAYIWERLDMEQEYWKMKAKEFDRIQKSIGNARDNLKERLRISMGKLEVNEVKGKEFRFTLSDTQGRLIIEDEKEVPEAYKTEVVQTVIDRADIKTDIKAGNAVPGAFIDYVPSLRKFANRKPQLSNVKKLKGKK